MLKAGLRFCTPPDGFQLHYFSLSQTELCVSWCSFSLLIREMSWLRQHRQLCHFFDSHGIYYIL